ncbi:hypothetical protein [Microcoleus sp. FACHB-831]|uniref:hypothetical protein n=1 Tax=Microcoleus sp. FACHB-831 TaxID=2692827 RepID=UPI0018F05530|nr:hypothetical protein [Microcoleus sp. FACHB-831]
MLNQSSFCSNTYSRDIFSNAIATIGTFFHLERSLQTTEDYAQLVPDLMFEVKSKTGSLLKLGQKVNDN